MSRTPGHRIALLALFALPLLWTTAGCTSPPTRYFVLVPSAAIPATLARPGLSLSVDGVSVPASLDRSSLVTRIDQHELNVSDLTRWAEPLSDNLAAVLAEDLGRLLGTEQVAAAPHTGSLTPELRVSVVILRLDAGAEPGAESGAGDEAVLVASWFIEDRHGDLQHAGRTRHTESVSGSGPNPIVRSLNLCVAALSRDIAAAIGSVLDAGGA